MQKGTSYHIRWWLLNYPKKISRVLACESTNVYLKCICCQVSDDQKGGLANWRKAERRHTARDASSGCFSFSGCS